MPYQATQLDGVFHALADPTRRAVLARLATGPAHTSDLARPFRMALPSFVQHMDVLEQSGLVKSRKAGRVRTWKLSPRPLKEAESWLTKRRALWESRLDQLDSYLVQLQQQKEPSK